jgi:hypothetical protein
VTVASRCKAGGALILTQVRAPMGPAWSREDDAVFANHEAFWWLLALVGAFVLVFVLVLWVRLSRREDRAAIGEAYRRDIRKPPDD